MGCCHLCSSLRVGRNGCKRDTTALLSCAVIMQSFSVVLRTPSSLVFLGANDREGFDDHGDLGFVWWCMTKQGTW